MKSLTIALAFLAAAALPAAAKTVTLAGLHPAKVVEAKCKFYGGTFRANSTGHGCTKAGYGRVWCSKGGKCVATYTDRVRLAQQ